MKFEEALQELKNGKKIKADTFEDGAYIENKEGNFYIIIRGEEKKFLFGIGYLEQNWDIFEEKDDWNWWKDAVKAYPSYGVIETNEEIRRDVKLLKEKIIDDCNRYRSELIIRLKTYHHENSSITESVYEPVGEIKSIIDKRFGF